MKRVDEAFVAHDVERHPGKGQTGLLNATCIGVDVVDGVRLRASANKLPVLLAALCWVFALGRAAPKTIEVFLGHIQWFNLLARPIFSVLNALYVFARLEPADVALDLDPVHLGELSLIVLLAPFWQSDLRKPWLPLITGTDASVDFGFGVCAAPCSAAQARKIGRLSEKRGDYVMLM